MGELNEKQLEFARSICIPRDGYFCKSCKKPFSTLPTVVNVDHINGDKKYNPPDGSNWQLLCHSCNVIKWHKQKLEVILDGGSPEGSALTLTVGSKMEYNWVKWLYEILIQKKEVSTDFTINTGALEINASPVTTKRYLIKQVSDENHEKAIFRKVYKNFDTYIRLTKNIEDSFEFNKNLT